MAVHIARSLKAALAAGVCLLPLQALAQNSDGATPPQSAPGSNWVTLGSQYDSGPSLYLGRYSGTVRPGFYGLGDFHIGQRDPWDSGGTNYFEANGSNLGLWNRSFDARIGQQGTWGLGFSYQGIPYYATDSFKSIWTSNGSLVPGVTPGGIGVTYRQIAPAVRSLGAPYPAGVVGPPVWQPVYTNSPGALLFNYNLSTRRDVFMGTGKYQWDDWTITGAVRHEHKSGYQANSLTINGLPSVVTSSATQPTAFTSGMGYFAQPIDYDMDRYDVTAAYGNERLQAQIGYTFSNFTDNNTVFNAVNPYRFTTTPPTPGSIFVPYTQAPSNSAHQIKVMVGYNFSPTTRLMGNFAYGLQLQNSPFQMASGNPSATFGRASAASLANFEPRGSLNGLVQTLYGNLALTAQPLPKLDIRLAYTIDDRSNKTQRSTFLTDVTSGTATAQYTNVPFSYSHQKATAEAGYRILPQTKVTLNETFETTYRSYANASFVTSNTVTAKIRSLLLDDVFGALSYSHQNRNGHNYTSNLTWALLGVNQFDTFGFRTFFDVSRTRDEVKGTLDLSPADNLTASLMVKYANDTYPDGSYGLRNNRNISIGPDISWQAAPALSVHAFYTYQQLYYNQASVYESSTFTGLPPTPSASQFVVPWTSKTTDSVHTAGVNLDWLAIKDVLKFSLDYNFAYGNTAYALGDSVVFFGPAVAGSQITQAAINLQPLPNVKSMLNMVSLRGEYTFTPNTTLMMGYAYERFTANDFMGGISPTQYAGALLPGTPSQSDAVHVVYAMLRLKF
jgi:MtrB/PioB family decaheme-associated outer membrane protein